jgi:outer membrane lipoprotein-sorting protein
MKHLLLILFTVLCSLFTASAQTADLQKAVARYKKVTTITAAATKTSHKDAVAKDVVTKGTLTMKKPADVGITIDGGKDQLLMHGSEFTMVVKGKSHKTSSDKNPQFATFQAVFEYILKGGDGDLSKYSDLAITKQGTAVVITITPKADNKKAQRRMLFSSFVLTIDSRTSELKSLRMNERGGYTEYTFTGYKFN